MSGRPIDFQGIIDLDRKVIEQLEQFLQEKENRLAYQILHLFPSSLNETSAPVLLPSGNLIKLSEAVEGFSKKVRVLTKQDLSNQYIDIKADQVVREMNSALWEFTEVLEGCVVELFQQVRRVSIDRWHVSISSVVLTIKDILIHYIEDLIWTIRRLENPLRDYCNRFDLKSKKSWSNFISLGKRYLDSSLLRNLKQTEKFLKANYEVFLRRYNEYMLLSVKVEECLQNMKSHPILSLLDVLDQNLYIDVFRLLKTLELNPRNKKEVANDITRALKHLTSLDHVIYVFRVYYLEIKDAFFKSSIEWKSLNHDEENFNEAVEKLKTKVQEYQQELQQVIYTMNHYRLFMLKNDANPYIRSRWGFTEWIVGPEPAKARKLLNMIYAAQELEGFFNQFAESLVRDRFAQDSTEQQAREDIEKILHQMGQPLISRPMIRKYAEKLLNQLKQCDEVGSPHMAIISYFEGVFSKAMREDWKYHVLHEFPLFHQIYHLHQGLVECFEDPTHAFRIERFSLLFDQIEEWVKKEDVYSHVHEIELDMNDMKAYLQDFLASVQRTVRDKAHDPFFDETVDKLCHQLSEYRYLFGHFFFNLGSDTEDKMQLRNQFLFVDQYFESAENLLNQAKVHY